jgi:hypothetical protein
MSKPLFLQIGGSGAYRDMVIDHEQRHRAYCEKWSYAYFAITDGVEDAWYKLELALDAMGQRDWYELADNHDVWGKHTDPNKYDYIFLIDADVIIADFERDMRETLPPHAFLALTVHPYPSGFDVFHWQVGMSYWRNTPDARQFLTEVLADKDKYDRSDNVWNEQECINQKLQHGKGEWQRGLRTLPHWWNNNTHDMPLGQEVVAAFHGNSQPEVRRQIMREYAKAHPWPGQTEALPCGCKNLRGVVYDDGQVKCSTCGRQYDTKG